MNKFTLAAVALVYLAASAHAETYNYACRYEGESHLYSAKLDTTKRTITWRGKANDAGNSVYGNMKQVTKDCAKECFWQLAATELPRC